MRLKDLPKVAEFRLGPALLLTNGTVTGQRYIPTDPAVLHGFVGAAGSHNLLARQVPVGAAQAVLVCAHPTAVAESPLHDVLGTNAAVGGLVE